MVPLFLLGVVIAYLKEQLYYPQKSTKLLAIWGNGPSKSIALSKSDQTPDKDSFRQSLAGKNLYYIYYGLTTVWFPEDQSTW